MKPFLHAAATLTAAIAMSLSATAFSQPETEHEHKAAETAAGVTALSPALRELLQKEMRALQDGMQSIIPAYIAGSWHEIEHTALNMKNSYIMQQHLSATQAEELHAALPDSFLKLDQQFHYLAGMLQHAAEMEKAELVGFYFSELIEACVACHAEHAVHKFPALAPEAETVEHSH